VRRSDALFYFKMGAELTKLTKRAFQVRKSFLFTLRRFFEGLLDFVYPPTCLLCGERLETKEPFCSTCLEKSLDSLALVSQKGRKDFPHLRGEVFFDEIVSCWDYTSDVEEIIHRIKYQRGKKLGLFMGQTAGEALRGHFRRWKDGLFVPVPLHKVRKRERGFNQSEILCRGLSEYISFRVCPDLLVRHRNTATQTKLDAQGRQENVKDAFEVHHSDLVVGKRVVLVDDVVTTGATMNSCAKSLKNAGAKEVVGVALARPKLG